MPKDYCPLCRGGMGSGNGRWGVNLAEIQRAFERTGQVGESADEVKNVHLENAIYYAPVRTGRLKARHYARWLPPRGAFEMRYVVGTTAEYARFLLGTAGKGAGYIYPKNGDELEVRPAPYSWYRASSPGRFRDSVKGQREHPRSDWLAKAATETFELFGLNILGGYSPRS